ncbi:Trihelix transcription factor PTL, partial [Mucuna pruriens]
MEDHHHHHHHQHQHQPHHFGMTDLRHVLNGPRPPHDFPSMPPHPTAELFPGHRNLTPLPTPQQHYEVMMFSRDIMPPGLHDFASTTHDSAAATIAMPTPSATTGFDADGAGCIAGDASTGRWPRQETLTLLEIRSRLDPKFKEANHKGPLWDEVSRIMSEEHGYQRSGKKCREKFENLYKYYKKTKEGKAGRHDGKHYRFFRQLEALYGENSNTVSIPETNVVSSIHFQANSHAPSQTNQDKFHSHNNKHCDSLSLTNSTNFDTSSSDDGNDHSMENESMEKRRKRKSGRSWKVKIKEFIDSQMRKLVEKQKEWLDKLVKTLEDKEKERMVREEEWRKQEANRLEREQKFWAKERAWIEARDAALMEALQKLTGREIMKAETNEGIINAMAGEVQNQNNEDGSEILNSSGVIRGADSWPESEIARLQQLRAEMGTRFPHSEISEEVTWEEVATKMACFGYERSALMCKEKWESMSNYPREDSKEGNKKRKENSRSCFYFKNNDGQQSSLYDQGSAYCDDINHQRPNGSSSPSKSNVANVPQADSCFPFLMSTEGGNLWDNDYGLKLNKANQNH